jgi:hypothetical protein
MRKKKGIYLRNTCGSLEAIYWPPSCSSQDTLNTTSLKAKIARILGVSGHWSKAQGFNKEADTIVRRHRLELEMDGDKRRRKEEDVRPGGGDTFKDHFCVEHSFSRGRRVRSYQG